MTHPRFDRGIALFNAFVIYKTCDFSHDEYSKKTKINGMVLQSFLDMPVSLVSEITDQTSYCV
jgi:hypothetical protein